MKGNELREIRVGLGFSQKDFAKKLEISQPFLCRMEKGSLEVNKKVEKLLENKSIEKQLEINIKKRTTMKKTNKVFSRQKFLENMLTGNKVIDNLYKEADWIIELDNKPVYLKKKEKLLEDNKGNFLGILNVNVKHIIKIGKIYNDFFCKMEWTKEI